MKKAIGLIIVILCGLLFLGSRKFHEEGLLITDGVALKDDTAVENLRSEADILTEVGLETETIASGEFLYSRDGHFYYGDDKNSFYADIPLWLNEGQALYNLSDKTTLISHDFSRLPAYRHLIVADGISYNRDGQQADPDEWIFMELPSGIYAVVQPMMVSSLLEQREINLNSLLFFEKDAIRYYQWQDGSLKFWRMGALNEQTEVTIGEHTYRYHDLLIQLGLLEQDAPQQSTEPTETPQETVMPTLTPTPTSSASGDSSTDHPTETVQPSATPNELQPIPSSNPEAGQNPEGEASRPEQEGDASTETGGTDSSGGQDTTPQNPDYVKPTVTFEPFIADIYGAHTEKVTIMDPARRLTKGIRMEVYYDQRLYMRKMLTASGAFSIGPLPPDRDYTLRAVMIYRNGYGQEVEETVYEQEIRTLSMDLLETMKIDGWKTGKLAYQSIELTDIAFAENPDDPIYSEPEENENLPDGETDEDEKPEIIGYHRYGETTIPYVYSLKWTVKNTTNQQSYTFTLPSAKLKQLKVGEVISYQTPNLLTSNSHYEVTMKAYDQFANELPLELNPTSHQANTSMAPPTATLRLNQNEVGMQRFSVRLTNIDQVEIYNLRLMVRDGEGNPIRFTAEAEGAGVSGGFEYALSADKPNFTLELLELPSSEMYEAVILADFDLNDNQGLQRDVVVGSSKFTTLSITSLGYASFVTEVSQIEAHQAMIKMNFDKMRTSNVLLWLARQVEITISGENTSRQTLTFEGQDLIDFIDGKHEINRGLVVENLNSMTEYRIGIKFIVSQGGKEHEIRNINTTDTFKTLKQTPTVTIENALTTENLFEFYGIEIEDIDGAIGTVVLMQVVDNNQNVIFMETLPTNTPIERITVSQGLTKDSTYYLEFYGLNYNTGYTSSSMEPRHRLYRSTLTTTAGLSGWVHLEFLDSENMYTEAVRNSLTQGKYLSNFGKVTNHPDWNYSDYLPIRASTSYYVKNLYLNNGQVSWVNFYDAEKNWISYAAPSTNEIVNAPDNAAYMRVNVHKNYVDQVEIIKDGLFNPDETVTATLHVNLQDLKNDLVKNPKFTLKTYSRKNESEDWKPYHEVDHSIEVENGQTKDVLGLFEMQVEPLLFYRTDLCVDVFGYELVLGSTEYSAEQNVTPIYTQDDFKKINANPDGKFIVLQDIVIDKSLAISHNTTNPYFTGILDGQGFKLSITIPSKSNQGDMRLGLIRYNGGTIQNIVLDYRKQNTDYNVTVSALVYQNNGLIQNVQLTVSEMPEVAQNGTGFIAYNNGATGIIENFTIRLDDDVHIATAFGAATYQNAGIVRNGYVFGEGKIIRSVSANSDNPYQVPWATGGAVGRNMATGTVEQVFVTTDIVLEEQKTNEVGGVVGINSGVSEEVRNLLYTGEITYYPNLQSAPEPMNPAYGPTVSSTGAVTKNVFYADNSTTYDNTKNRKVPVQSLHDPNWHKYVLDVAQSAFCIDENVMMGYFPSLQFPEIMPTAERVPLPKLDGNTTLNLLSVLVDRIEVLENGEQIIEATASFLNPQEIGIVGLQIQYLDVEVLEQIQDKNISRVKIRLKNPQKYLSRYAIQGFYYDSGIAELPGYSPLDANDGYMVEAEFYHPIASIEEWRTIAERPDENHRLVADLDFAVAGLTPSQIQIGEFLGKFDGGKYDSEGNLIGLHTLSNINVYNVGSVFKNLIGTIRNVHVTGFTSTTASAQENIGFIGYAQNGAMIENVHLENVVLTANKYAGGLVARTYFATVRNSSVTDLKLNSEFKTGSEVRFGGLIGTAEGTSLERSYSQGIELQVINAAQMGGVGGLIGRNHNEGANPNTIDGCYSEGKIESMFRYVGGLFGNATATNSIKHSWSNVEILTMGSFTGGIAGHLNGATNISHVLSIGNLFSRVENLQQYGRLSGTHDSGYSSSYAYSDQKIDGLISGETTGATLLTHKQLTQPDTYREELDLEGYFDLSQVQEGILPKIVDENGQLLPYQRDHRLVSADMIEVTGVVANTQGNTTWVTVSLNHSADVKIEQIHFDGLKVENLQIEALSNGIQTNVLCSVTPEKYYDRYQLDTVQYSLKSMPEEILNYPVVALVETQFFKDISNVEDWQNLVDPNSYENYRITGVIDFTGVSNPNWNVRINRLVGSGTAEGEKQLFRGGEQAFELSATGSVIGILTGGIENIEFADFNLTIPKGTSIGIIGINQGIIEQTDFTDITLNVGASNRVGMIGENSGVLRFTHTHNANIYGTGNYYGGLVGWTALSSEVSDNRVTGSSDNPKLSAKEDIYHSIIEGSSTIGGVIGYCQTGEYHRNHSESIHVKAMMDNVGGVLGSSAHYDYLNPTSEFSATHVKVEAGRSSAGGVQGGGGYGARDYQAQDVYVFSPRYAGGIIGNFGAYTAERCVTIDSEIEGMSYVGGIAGQMHSATYNYVKNTTVKGEIEVGGIGGRASTVNHSGVINCHIEAQEAAGGLAGFNYGSSFGSFVLNSEILARQKVGGLAGTIGEDASQVNGKIDNCYASNVEVRGDHYVGGFVGYYNKRLNTQGDSASRYLRNSYFIGEVSGADYVGGAIGYTTLPLRTPDENSLIVAAKVNLLQEGEWDK